MKNHKPRPDRYRAQSQAIGRSRGERATTIHAVADEQGAHRRYPPDARTDIRNSGARAFLPTIPSPEYLIADKAYRADDRRAFLIRQGSRSVISPMPNRQAMPAFDPVAYRSANSSNAPSAGSRAGAPSPHATTKPHETSSLVSVLSSPPPRGSVKSRT